MKNQYSLIVKGLIRGISYELALFIIFKLVILFDFFIGSFRVGKMDVSLFIDMWFVNTISVLFDCFLYILPCVIGGIAYVFIERRFNKASLLIDLCIHTIIYIAGLMIVIKVTRIKLEFYSSDAIVYGFIALITILFWLLKENKKRRKSSTDYLTKKMTPRIPDPE